MGTLVFQANLGGAVNLNGPNIASTVNFTLPSADGTNGQAMVTNGSGTLSFATISTAAATPTVLGTVYGKMTTSGASPYLTAIGYNAAPSVTGVGNTATGFTALFSNITGTNNTAFGKECMYKTTGDNNTGVGEETLYNNTSGSQNTAIGRLALNANTTASNNTAVGYQAGYSNTTGTFNTFIGRIAGYSNSTGNYITAVGHNALNACTGDFNTAVGRDALYLSTSGVENTAVGANAMDTNTTGSYNTAVGKHAVKGNTTGSNNTGVGFQCLYNNTTASYNTSVGHQAGYSINTGAGNVCMGYTAGYNLTTGSYGVYIGIGTQPSAGGNISEIVIGSGAGGGNITGKGTTTGYINPQGGGVYQGNNSSTWSTTSDRRLKKNIVDNNTGLEKLMQVQVRNFEYRLPKEIDELEAHCAIKKEGVQLGVIAQELQQVLPDCVKQESTGVLSVDPDNLTWYLINAVKQLKAEIDALKGN